MKPVISSYPDAHVGYAAIERSMQRARRRVQPPIPQSVDDAHAQLLESDFFRYYFCVFVDMTKTNWLLPNICRNSLDGVNRFYHGRVTSTTGSALVFVSVPLVSYLRHAKEVHADGTFKTVPRFFYQLFTLHMVAYKKVMLRLKYFLSICVQQKQLLIKLIKFKDLFDFLPYKF